VVDAARDAPAGWVAAVGVLADATCGAAVGRIPVPPRTAIAVTAADAPSAAIRP
jgi:hypothetical protein